MNKLKLNESTTEFFIAASIKPSQSIGNPGAYFDSNMTMASHINNVSCTITIHLRNISCIHRFIDKDTCHHAVRSLIILALIILTVCFRRYRSHTFFFFNAFKIGLQDLFFTVNRDPKPLLKSLHW